jgi:hypothetical protein
MSNLVLYLLLFDFLKDKKRTAAKKTRSDTSTSSRHPNTSDVPQVVAQNDEVDINFHAYILC